jgi:hypothetical protein
MNDGYSVIRVVLVACLPPIVAGCSTSGGALATADGLTVAGDKNGGKIQNGVGAKQSAAMTLVTEHCAQFGRKGFVTQMDFQGGTLTFECREQRPKAAN